MKNKSKANGDKISISELDLKMGDRTETMFSKALKTEEGRESYNQLVNDIAIKDSEYNIKQNDKFTMPICLLSDIDYNKLINNIPNLGQARDNIGTFNHNNHLKLLKLAGMVSLDKSYSSADIDKDLYGGEKE
jgi:hypothetical protein